MTQQDFVRKWQAADLKERAAAQEHFIDLCRLLEVATPTEADPTGTNYAFERRVNKAAGGKGFADVWKRGCFGWEYKGKRADLQDAYMQLLLYRDDLENPPLLVVSDMREIQVHTNFTGTPKRVHRIELHDLLKPEGMDLLRKVFTNPEALNPKYYRERVTEEASAQIGSIALKLRQRGHDTHEVAHFLMRLVFALFAEDVDLLPNRLVSRILERTTSNPERAQQYFTQLFQAMATGGEVLLEDIPYFNGGLFDGREALPLAPDELAILYEAARLDWGEVEPVIFGTLFERSLDPEKRSQLGAHYTSREDILRIVEPVVMAPLREEWQGIREDVEAFLTNPPADPKRAASQRKKRVDEPLFTFLQRLQNLRVLDPACGSGNFLYVAMQQVKDLERDVVTLAQTVGAPGFPLVGPRQFYGLEVSVFAHELASMVVWIGYLQWNRANGFSNAETPILKKLDTIRLQDALMTEEGTEAEWPEVDFIIGNPPFLGDRKMRRELGHEYVESLRRLFYGRIPGSDFVCYWFEKARAMIEAGRAKRAGLIATNSIATGENSKVLSAIKGSGDIFMAWRDEPWVLEGAAVRVSMVGFGNGEQQKRVLDGYEVASITPALTAGI